MPLAHVFFLLLEALSCSSLLLYRVWFCKWFWLLGMDKDRKPRVYRLSSMYWYFTESWIFWIKIEDHVFAGYPSCTGISLNLEFFPFFVICWSNGNFFTVLLFLFHFDNDISVLCRWEFYQGMLQNQKMQESSSL